MLEPSRDPAEIVTGFLRWMEAGDLASARACTAPGFSMQFPGAPAFTDLAELLAWSRKRYASVRKTFDRIDVAHKDGVDAVYVSGTLSGHWLDSTAFRGIRYVDCFDIEDGRIVRQRVWNDMGEARLARTPVVDLPIRQVDDR